MGRNNTLSKKNNFIYQSCKSERKKADESDNYAWAKMIDSYNQKPIQFFFKNCIEKVGTLLGIMALSPFFLLIAILIKLDSQGPVLYKQERVGRLGKKFYMYKFRSMYSNADQMKKHLEKYNQTNLLMFKLENDPRVTKIGKILRKFSLDEFPQLINVMKGEMSLVGFRPPLQEEVNKYKPNHYVRFAAIPGLTGPWQVGGRSRIKNFDKVIDLEYNYIKDWNLLTDISILFKTIPVVLFGDDFT